MNRISPKFQCILDFYLKISLFSTPVWHIVANQQKHPDRRNLAILCQGKTAAFTLYTMQLTTCELFSRLFSKYQSRFGPSICHFTSLETGIQVWKNKTKEKKSPLCWKNMPQPRQLTCLWRKMVVLVGVIFSLSFT